MTPATASAPTVINPTIVNRREYREELAQRVAQAFAKLADYKEDIEELWNEFEALPEGETIMGCATKTEFCEKVLGRNIRTIQYLISGRPSQKGTWRKLTPEYNSWHMMIQRCTNPNYSDYANWGGRGITVCERWLGTGKDHYRTGGFENFLADMGSRPEGTTLGRKDGNPGYYPDNCEWQTEEQQTAERDTRRAQSSRQAHPVVEPAAPQARRACHPVLTKGSQFIFEGVTYEIADEGEIWDGEKEDGEEGKQAFHVTVVPMTPEDVKPKDRGRINRLMHDADHWDKSRANGYLDATWTKYLRNRYPQYAKKYDDAHHQWTATPAGQGWWRERKEYLERIEREQHKRYLETPEYACKVLGVPPFASFDEIKKGYRAKTLEFHPDRNSSPDAAEQMVAVNLAWQRLKQREAQRAAGGAA